MKQKNKLGRFFTEWTWKKGIIVTIISILVIGLGVFLYVANRVNNTLGDITGERQSIFRTARSLLPGTGNELANTDGQTNIVVAAMRGKDDPNGGLLADSVIILSLDKDTSQAAMISIPRDLRVQIPGESPYMKLNATHAVGYERGEGIETVMAVLEDISGVDMHYGVTVDFEAFTGIIDALGGVTVNVGQDFWDPNYEGGINVTAGPTYMDSETAKRYVWARMTSNDFDRSRRQREVINAMKDKAMQQGALSNPVFLLNVLDSLGDHVTTTMSVDEMKAALTTLSEMNLNAIIEKGYDTDPAGPFTSTTDPTLGYIIIPRGGTWAPFQADIQAIFDTAAEESEFNTESNTTL